MSAPTPAPGDDRPREGYYPDPSIPGYVRYWNGASWVPGTSRPAPKDGEPLAPPPGVRPAAPAVEETGPHFFDEDPEPTPSGRDGAGASADAGSGPGGWDTDARGGTGHAGYGDRDAAPSQPGPGGPHSDAAGAGRPGAGGQGVGQSGSGGRPAGHSGSAGDGEGRTAWGADPRVPAEGPAQPGGRADGTASTPPAEGDDQDPGGTFLFRRPVPGPAAVRDEGTMTFRPVPGQGRPDARPSGPGTPASPASGAEAGSGSGFGPHGSAQGTAGAASGLPPQGPDAGSGFGAQGPAQGPGFGGPGSGSGAAPGGFGPQGPVGPPGPSTPAGPGFGAGKAAAARAAAQTPQGSQPGPAAVAPSVPAQSGPPATPVTSGPGGGQASWAQQVHQLAGGGDEQPVAPWKPPVEDLFQAAARRQAAARPAGLGKRLAARLVDSLVVGAVTAAAAVPLGIQAVDHIQQKVDEAKLSGHEVTVWLLDGTTGTGLGIVLAVLLLVGVVYEVLPTAKWGRTLGKKLLGIEVRDIEAHEPPSFGAALRRWLAYSVPGLLGIGIVGVLWCLFDRPWHQCWHDKAAHTFVAG
ncbi:RDD family protein [Streptomyces sp. NPDC048191]|uniref:RDD family protein n=1 Tax=Streptomyces sp. NPDC048191 TaxID=3155484 RepID=UPI0033F92967